MEAVASLSVTVRLVSYVIKGSSFAINVSFLSLQKKFYQNAGHGDLVGGRSNSLDSRCHGDDRFKLQLIGHLPS